MLVYSKTGIVLATFIRPADRVARPGDDYQLQISAVKGHLNEPIAPDRFILTQQPGTELIRVGEESKESQP